MQWNPRKLPKNFQLLRKRIIEPAVKELTEKDGWLIEWEAVKSGRRVASPAVQIRAKPARRAVQSRRCASSQTEGADICKK